MLLKVSFLMDTVCDETPVTDQPQREVLQRACSPDFLLLKQGGPTQSFSSDQRLSHVQLFATPWTAASQASLSITDSQSLPKLMSTELVMPSNHLILCRSLLLPSIFPSIRVFSSESALHIRWPKYWSFSFNISPANEYLELSSFRMDWLDPELGVLEFGSVSLVFRANREWSYL